MILGYFSMEIATQAVQQNIVWFLGSLFVGLCLLIVIIAIVYRKIRQFEAHQEILFRGKEIQSLEEVILKNVKDIQAIDREIQELFNISNTINSLAQRSVHRIGIVRFNPFKDIGGDQSCSVALLDGKNNGFTLSALHTREGTRVYIKPITRGISDKYVLNEEEISAIEIAMNAKNPQE